MATVLVTGGTGTLGRAVVMRLTGKQHHTRVLSHQAVPAFPGDVEVITGDLVTGSGLREAVADVDAIIHCASDPRAAQQVDVEGTRALLQAARASGSPHIVYPSIVGVDRSTYAYYRAKYAAEGFIEHGPLPWTVVRITQFHDYVLGLIQSFEADTLPVVSVVGGMRFQSIDVGEVADRLVAFVEEGPSADTPDIGGPEIRTIEEMTEAYLRIRGRKATVRPEAGDRFQVFKSGINLVPDHAVGTITWEAFLYHRYGPAHTAGNH